MTTCCQAAYQLQHINEIISNKELPSDHRARALKFMTKVWFRCLPRGFFDVSFYEKLNDGSFCPHLGAVLYSSLGNGFLFSCEGEIFWYECQDYIMTKKIDGSFVCLKLNLDEIVTYAEEIIEALSCATPEISQQYCSIPQHTQTT